MKKIILSICLLAIAGAASAQSMRLGVKGAYNSTWLINTNISDHGDDLDYASTFGSSFGGSLLIGFAGKVGVSIDLLTSSQNQDFNGGDTSFSFKVSDKFKYFDIPVLLVINPDKGPYVEVGPQFGFLTGSTETVSINGSTYYSGKNFKSNYNSMSISAVLGFGYNIEASERVNIGLGHRFAWSLTDLTKEMSASQLNQETTSVLTSFAHDKVGSNAPSYVKTARAAGGFMISLMFKI
jgi:hypothetical protein